MTLPTPINYQLSPDELKKLKNAGYAIKPVNGNYVVMFPGGNIAPIAFITERSAYSFAWQQYNLYPNLR